MRLIKPRGTSDILPQQQGYWDFVRRTFREKVKRFAFHEIETPIFEDARVFLTSVGEKSDIVSKEMFSVGRSNDSQGKDIEKRKYVLRPEGTASIARAYVQQGLSTLGSPLKLFYIGPFFRYERPQKGRLRQFNQFGVEVLGDKSPTMDALVILLAWRLLGAFHLAKDIVLEVNTIGDKACQGKINSSLKNHFRKYDALLCQDCQNRLKTNPLRILDCKDGRCQKIIREAPQIIDLACENCQIHFRSLLEYLDELEIPYILNPRLVRGLDYYTRTVFEFRLESDDKRQSTLIGGGRYDELIKKMGGRQTPAIGFSGGIERIIELLQEKRVQINSQPPPLIHLILVGEQAKRKGLVLYDQLTKSGLAVQIAPSKNGLKSQLGYANKNKIKIALIIGQKEAYEGEVIVRCLEDHSQESVKIAKLRGVIEKMIKKSHKR